ncbi:hypothetical protein ACH5RR_007621 [Cinchona calisaya]|uniref:Uncharacterized protein n=1 Tax=Cinchona calisaya TaxID=153742 RepID=A0ABD3A987_9GENT
MAKRKCSDPVCIILLHQHQTSLSVNLIAISDFNNTPPRAMLHIQFLIDESYKVYATQWIGKDKNEVLHIYELLLLSSLFSLRGIYEFSPKTKRVGYDYVILIQ